MSTCSSSVFGAVEVAQQTQVGNGVIVKDGEDEHGMVEDLLGLY